MSGERILVVDDEPHIRRVIQMKLKTAGFKVEMASTGALALELAQSFQPHLIVTDFNLRSGIMGIELLKAFRGLEETCDVPIILVTGSVAAPDKLEMEMDQLGQVSYAYKPFSPKKLLALVKQLIEANVASKGEPARDD